MSREIWFISDTHFGHGNILGFTGVDGLPIRPEFKTVGDMDEHMIWAWNHRIGPRDKVYHLGDFAMGLTDDQLRELRGRLNGSINLILGNHDDAKRLVRLGLFKKVQLWRKFKDEGFVASHVPMHRSSFHNMTLNLHGHIHEKVVTRYEHVQVSEGYTRGMEVPDPAYMNVSVENVNYDPVHIDEVSHRVRAMKELMK